MTGTFENTCIQFSAHDSSTFCHDLLCHILPRSTMQGSIVSELIQFAKDTTAAATPKPPPLPRQPVEPPVLPPPLCKWGKLQKQTAVLQRKSAEEKEPPPLCKWGSSRPPPHNLPPPWKKLPRQPVEPPPLYLLQRKAAKEKEKKKRNKKIVKRCAKAFARSALQGHFEIRL